MRCVLLLSRGAAILSLSFLLIHRARSVLRCVVGQKISSQEKAAAAVGIRSRLTSVGLGRSDEEAPDNGSDSSQGGDMAQNEGPPVANALNGDEAYWIPLVFGYLVNGQQPINERARLHLRRFLIMAVLSFILLLAGAAAAILLSGKSNNNSGNADQTRPMYMTALGLDQSAKVFRDPLSPQYVALKWIMHEDPQSLPANATNLIQRYVLAVFHLATSSPNKPWKSCDYYSWKQNMTNNNNNNNNMTQSDYCEFAPDIDENRAQNGTEAIWMSGARECEWAGVVCDQATDSMVEIIVVNNMGLSQTVPSEIGMLTHLQLLHMSANELVGTLPSELSNLRKLENFHINSNDLTGMIPSWLFDMPTLTTLGLNNNRFSGTISTSIGQLKNLRELYLGENELNGTIPIEVGQLTNLGKCIDKALLHRFVLRWNVVIIVSVLPPIDGSIARHLLTHFFFFNIVVLVLVLVGVPHCVAEVQLWLSGNILTGTIPSEIGSLTSLRSLWLKDLLLHGTIPSQIGNCRSMYDVRLSLNNLGGTIPNELYGLPGLLIVLLGENLLSGTISPDIKKLNYLSMLSLQGNLLTGPIPSEVASSYFLQILRLEGNRLNGTMPMAVCDGHAKMLRELSADCLAGTAGEGPPVACDCCTSCCSTSDTHCSDAP